MLVKTFAVDYGRMRMPARMGQKLIGVDVIARAAKACAGYGGEVKADTVRLVVDATSKRLRAYVDVKFPNKAPSLGKLGDNGVTVHPDQRMPGTGLG